MSELAPKLSTRTDGVHGLLHDKTRPSRIPPLPKPIANARSLSNESSYSAEIDPHRQHEKRSHHGTILVCVCVP